MWSRFVGVSPHIVERGAAAAVVICVGKVNVGSVAVDATVKATVAIGPAPATCDVLYYGQGMLSRARCPPQDS